MRIRKLAQDGKESGEGTVDEVKATHDGAFGWRDERQYEF